ncbi:hypothetical protein AAXB25_14400 [Paenibacillus lautus]|uniref:hypothetical protein n=1 Tax=Paenibacillus lautus TaxID=1401 RepID=UPI003D2CEA91
MITFIVLGIIICTIFFVCFITQIEDKTSVKDWLANFATSYLLIGILYVIIGGLVFMAITTFMATKWEYGWDNKIVAMKDSTAYVVSRHNVESSDRYYYMVEYGSGHYKQHWVNQSNSDIYETDRDSHVVKTYTKVIEPRNWIMKDLEKFRRILLEDERRWEFYVPKGSVVQDFTLDLK